MLMMFSVYYPQVVLPKMNLYPSSTVLAPSGVHLGNGVTNADATGSMIPNCRMQKHLHLDSFMYSIDFLDFPGPHLYPPSFDSENT